MCILGVVLIVSFASDAVFQEGSFVCMCLAIDKIGFYLSHKTELVFVCSPAVGHLCCLSH